jgi:hypothetical protein
VSVGAVRHDAGVTNPASLVASHPGNMHALKNGLRAQDGRAFELRAREVAEEFLAMPWVIRRIDEAGALELGKWIARCEAIDAELEKCGLDGPEARVAWLMDLRSRASRRVMDGLREYAATPAARARFLKDYAQGRSLSAEIARRRRAAGETGLEEPA